MNPSSQPRGPENPGRRAFLGMMAFALGAASLRAQSAQDLFNSAEKWANDNLDDDVLRVLTQLDRDRVEKGLAELEERLHGDSVYDLGPLKQTATSLLPILQHFQETLPLAEWLQSRFDYLDAADQFKRESQPTPPKPGAPPAPPPSPQRQRAFWNKKVEKKPLPPKAQAYVPQLRPIFTASKVPSQMVWLGEIESGFNPDARSPAGAEGMFQLMKPTAKRFGLSTSMPDDRRDPQKSARAAAAYLRLLQNHFGDWRLALSAYNAGEGRVDAAIKQVGSRRYEDLVGRLPAETQMYVPRYEATLKKREGLTLADLKTPA